MSILESSFVSVRVSLKCSRFNNAFAVHQLILFDLLLRVNTVILCLPHNVIVLAYGGLTSFGQRFTNVIQNVLFEYGKVQLLASFAVERDSSYFTFLLALLGLVALVLWSTRSKLCNCVAFIELVLEIAQIITKRRFDLSQRSFENHTVGVKIENALFKLVEA